MCGWKLVDGPDDADLGPGDAGELAAGGGGRGRRAGRGS